MSDTNLLTFMDFLEQNTGKVMDDELRDKLLERFVQARCEAMDNGFARGEVAGKAAARLEHDLKERRW